MARHQRTRLSLPSPGALPALWLLAEIAGNAIGVARGEDRVLGTGLSESWARARGSYWDVKSSGAAGGGRNGCVSTSGPYVLAPRGGQSPFVVRSHRTQPEKPLQSLNCERSQCSTSPTWAEAAARAASGSRATSAWWILVCSLRVCSKAPCSA